MDDALLMGMLDRVADVDEQFEAPIERSVGAGRNTR